MEDVCRLSAFLLQTAHESESFGVVGDRRNDDRLLKPLLTVPLQMPVDVTAILVSSTFMGAGLALAKFFPESSLLAAFFLGGLALVNIALSIAG